LAACGGSVVFVEDDDGAGGATTSSSTSSKQPTSGKTTTAVTTGPGTTNVGTTVGPTTGVTTGPGPEPLCVFAEVDDVCNECVGEAQLGPCEIPVTDCLNTDECLDYGDCAFNCGGAQACCNDCAAGNPLGAKLYTDAVFCMVCQACPMECFGAVPGLCR
jgi:hypothetical protein